LTWDKDCARPWWLGEDGNMFRTLILLADGGAAEQGYGLLLPVGIAFLFYFLLWRPMRRQEMERAELLKSLKKNDKIITNAGIYGTVISVSDTDDEMIVKVDDNVRLKMLKSGVLRNLSNEEAAREAVGEAKKQ
jgi:preprotein translocase subunit YajC